jgi:hypothetical protein
LTNLRFLFYKHTRFEIQRIFYFIQNSNRKIKELDSFKVGKLQRQKIEVVRNKPIDNCLINFQSNDQKVVLEFFYKGEEGSGLGPTLEMYQDFGT